MPIEKDDYGNIMITGKGDIDFFSWLALRGALKLEIKTGMKLSRGRSASQIAIHRLGLTGRPRKKTVLEALEARMKEMYPTWQPD